ncbi:MAG: hypothetical protein JF607_01260 [Burkholderiales bacterium]|nr:hypothetical protein [Burkholderiales bacterium]
MLDPAGELAIPAVIVRVDIDHRGRSATYLVDGNGSSLPAMRPFYAQAGDLLADLRALEARDSPTEGSLIERVRRHARTVAAEPNMEAAIGFIDRNGETGLVRVTGLPKRTVPPDQE